MKKRIIVLLPVILFTFGLTFFPIDRAMAQDAPAQQAGQVDQAAPAGDAPAGETAEDEGAAGEEEAAAAPAEMAETEKDSGGSLWEIFSRGGPFMWPILLLAAVGIGFIIERIVFFVKTKLASKEFIEELEHKISTQDLNAVEKLCNDSDNKLAKILLKGLALKSLGYERVEKALTVAAGVEVSFMERGLNILNAIGNIVPMLGFLGTVSGMISAFSDIAAADQVSAKIVAGGIMEALITTATGLIIAIPTLLAYNYFVHKIDGFISEVERIAADVVEKLIEKKDTVSGSPVSSTPPSI